MVASNEESLKVPVPEVVQIEKVALPPNVPAVVDVLPAQMVASGPALTVAMGFTVSAVECMLSQPLTVVKLS